MALFRFSRAAVTRVVSGTALLLSLVACQREATSRATWELDFADSASRGSARAVDAVIWRGGCRGGMELYRAQVRPGRTGPRPPPLARGLYGFGGEARNDACEVIARGCTEVRLPADAAHVRIVLEPASGPPACHSDSCTAGRCGNPRGDAGGSPPQGNPDAGESGAAHDAVRMDGGPADARPSPDHTAPLPDARGQRDAAPPGHGRLDAGPEAAMPPDGTRPDGGMDVQPEAGPAPDGGDGSALDCVPYAGRCYHFDTGARDWPSAEAACIAWGGHLVTLDDADEESWMLARWGPDLELWVGLNDRASEGAWVWADGSGSPWRHWAPGAPDDTPRDEDCAAYRSDRLGWDDRNCRQGKAFLCERVGP